MGYLFAPRSEKKHPAKLRDDVYNISPFHGRSALYEGDGGYHLHQRNWLDIRGASIVTSPKDPVGFFGLFDKKFAEELKVSKVLNSHGIRACKVLRMVHHKEFHVQV